MAASGSSLLQHRNLRAGRATLLLRPIALAQLGVRSVLRPTQVALCSATVCARRASAYPQSRRRRGRQLVVRAVAMVNVDFASPSLLLGAMLIGCGVLLLNLRNFQNKVSRDADIVVAAMVSIVGSTLIFQGWRLDPLLLLCQALTTSVALWYGLETFRLRSKEADLPPQQLPPGVGIGADPSASLDPAAQQAAAAMAAAAQQQQQQFYQASAGFPPGGPGVPFLPPGSEPYYPWSNTADSTTSTSGRATGPFGETIQYDYYGNPMMPAQEPVYSNAGYNTYNDAAVYGAPGDPYGAGNGGPAGVGYDARGPAMAAGSSYGGSAYAAAAPPPPGSSLRGGGPSTSPQVDDGQQQQQPPLASSSDSSSSNGGYFSPGGSPGSLFDGYGMSTAGSASGSPWDSIPGPAAGAGFAGPGSGRGDYGGGSGGGKSATRLDLFEQVDDWE